MAADVGGVTLEIRTNPELQALQRVINLLAVADLTPRAIASEHRIGELTIAIRFAKSPPRLPQLLARIEAQVSVHSVGRVPGGGVGRGWPSAIFG
ncbi:hypothetical protein [Sphingomonas antarctica]|uniref:hypothetical protein n=1 Tax=Sphingomonas antarctica TaxID=2040274 RepID=UPI0039EA8926